MKKEEICQVSTADWTVDRAGSSWAELSFLCRLLYFCQNGETITPERLNKADDDEQHLPHLAPEQNFLTYSLKDTFLAEMQTKVKTTL